MNRSVVEVLIPPAREEANAVAALPSNVIGLDQLKAMPLQEQVRTLLRRASVVPFEQLRSLLGVGRAEEERLLAFLAEDAVLVQGSWVMASHLLYPDMDPHASTSKVGPEPELMRKARDLLLYRLDAGEPLSRKDISSAVRLASEHLTELLHGVATHRPSKGYVFPYPLDEAFKRRYPVVAAAQAAKWEARWAELQLWVRENQEAAAHPPPPARVHRKSSTRRRTNSHRASHSFDAAGDGPAKIHPPPFEPSNQQQRKRQKSGEQRGKAPADVVKAEPNGVPEEPLTEEGHKELAQFLSETFSDGRLVLGAAEASRLLAAAALEAPADSALAELPSPLPSGAFVKAAVAAGALKVTHKDGVGLAVWPGAGEGRWPGAQSFLATWLTHKNRFRFKTFKDSLSKALPSELDVPPDAELRSLLAEYCALDKGSFVLSGSLAPPPPTPKAQGTHKDPKPEPPSQS